MSREPIALVGLAEPEAEAGYRDALARAMPDERIRPFRELSRAERAGIEIAIVANPDPAEVAALTGLAWIHSLWAGVERLVAALGPAAPPIVRLVDPEMARTMAEAVLAWTHYLQRDMPLYARQQREGVWRQHPYRAPADVAVGLLGHGALGAAAADRLRQAGFPVGAWSRSPREVSRGIRSFSGDGGLRTLLAASDVVVCLLPLTGETRGLLDAGRLSAMRPGAALVNFARGPIVVEGDLVAALDRGHLSHAVLDVFDAEPLPASSPLWRHPCVTVLPHVAGPTNRETAAEVVAGNVRAYRATGRVPGAVNPGLGY